MASAYFKSTDGHTDHCQFSLRRLNIHLLPLVRDEGGLILVDSTRRGKRMPDALSKTVPIWCCVLNRAANLLLDRKWSPEQTGLSTPGKVVSVNEHRTIEGQIDAWVTALIDSGIDQALLEVLDKPLRPLWVTPDSRLTGMSFSKSEQDFYPLILVTASKCVPDGIERLDGFTYNQGAADDEEMWARGLTPDLFWKLQNEILSSSVDCETTIDRLVSQGKKTRPSGQEGICRVRIGKTNVYACVSVTPDDLLTGIIIDLSLTPQLHIEHEKYLHVPVSEGKKGSSQFAAVFEKVDEFLKDAIARRQDDILITDDESCKSKGSTTILMILSQYFNQDGAALDKKCEAINKDLIRNRLVTIVNSRPGLNPNRASLKSVNEYLMSNVYRPSPR